MAKQLSWVLTIDAAGTAEAGPTTGPGIFLVKADAANTGSYVYIGNDGEDDVTNANGYKIGTSEQVVIHVGPGGLAEYMFDVDTDGDKIVILKVGGEAEGPAA